MINILFIHQSADLYGSDKTLLLLLKNLDKKKFNPVVVIPIDGPLKTELENNNIEVYIAPALKLYRKIFTPKNILKFFSEHKTAVKFLDTLNEKHHFDIVYSNTLAILLGIIYAKKRKIKHIWHVHEIIESPKIFTSVFSKILQSKSNTKIVYNSIATQKFWNTNKKIYEKSQVIWNGLEAPQKYITKEEKALIRLKYYNSKPDEIVIGLIGRISRWKGQLFLLNSFIKAAKNQPNLKLVFIGSPPPNQEEFLENLNNNIKKNQISNQVLIIPFQENIFSFWQSIDIAIVPSTEPEPFGLVAVEAMLAQKPVIAANHGGLPEIVIDGQTGILFEPNNEDELTKAIQYLVNNPKTRIEMGENGRQRAVQTFSIASYIQNLENIFLTMK